jgi:hypothetical protein
MFRSFASGQFLNNECKAAETSPTNNRAGRNTALINALKEAVRLCVQDKYYNLGTDDLFLDA